MPQKNWAKSDYVLNPHRAIKIFAKSRIRPVVNTEYALVERNLLSFLALSKQSRGNSLLYFVISSNKYRQFTYFLA